MIDTFTLSSQLRNFGRHAALSFVPRKIKLVHANFWNFAALAAHDTQVIRTSSHNPSNCARQHRRASAASKSGRVIPESEIHRALGPGFGWPLGVSLERLHWHSRSVRFEQLVQSPFQKLRAHGRVPASSAVSERKRLCGMSREARQAVPCLPDEGGHQSVTQNE